MASSSLYFMASLLGRSLREYHKLRFPQHERDVAEPLRKRPATVVTARNPQLKAEDPAGSVQRILEKERGSVSYFVFFFLPDFFGARMDCRAVPL